jgi:hypothetical protein
MGQSSSSRVPLLYRAGFGTFPPWGKDGNVRSPCSRHVPRTLRQRESEVESRGAERIDGLVRGPARHSFGPFTARRAGGIWISERDGLQNVWAASSRSRKAQRDEGLGQSASAEGCPEQPPDAPVSCFSCSYPLHRAPGHFLFGIHLDHSGLARHSAVQSTTMREYGRAKNTLSPLRRAENASHALPAKKNVACLSH